MLWLLLIPALLFAAYLFLIWPRLPRRDVNHLLGIDYAHRGLWDAECPENSLPAFARAAELGFGVELDVQMTRDGELIVFHDDDLKRMCGVSGLIWERTRAELDALRLAGTDCRIPTFAQVLETLGGRVPVIVEIKTGPEVLTVCEKALALLRAYPGVWCVESFDPKAMHWWRRHDPQTIRGTLSCGLRATPRGRRTLKLAAMAALVENVLTRPDFIAYDHETDRNLSMAIMRLLRPTLVTWTVRSQQDMDRLRGRYDLQIFEGFLPKR